MNLFTFKKDTGLPAIFGLSYFVFVDDRPIGFIDKKPGCWWAFRDDPEMNAVGIGKLDQTFETRKEAAEALWE